MVKEQEMLDCYVMQLGRNRCMNTYMHHVKYELRHHWGGIVYHHQTV